AGMFHADFRPVGLLVVAGRMIGDINRSSGFGNFFVQPNGVFMFVAEGVAGRIIGDINRSSGFGNFFVQPNGVFMLDADGGRVLPTYAYRNYQPVLATQSGPMLVDRGL